VTVSRDESETDYSSELDNAFKRFSQDAEKDYRIKFSPRLDRNFVEEQILERVAKLYPKIFKDLSNYWIEHRNFLDDTIELFDKEIQFYVSYLEYMATFKRTGLKFCYPQILSKKKEIISYGGFDLALAS
jgi:hypothetical protein